MARDRRALPPRAAEIDFTRIQPDPSQVGGVAEAPFVRLPDPASLFVRRAARFRTLAENHPLGDYLRFLAQVADAQAGIVEHVPSPATIPAGPLALALEHGMPPLGAVPVRDNAEFDAALLWLLDHADLSAAPEAAQASRLAVRVMSPTDRASLANDVVEGAFPLDQIGEALFVAAALQVFLARQAAQLDSAAFSTSPGGVCPVCGGPPVASLVVGWTQASKARYCACALCGTLWNHVRIKCTSCGSTDGIAYYTIEDGQQTVGVEACDACHSYIKHMQQHQDGALDPIADDVASYALDLLAREREYRRAGVNPLFLTG